MATTPSAAPVMKLEPASVRQAPSILLSAPQAAGSSTNPSVPEVSRSTVEITDILSTSRTNAIDPQVSGSHLCRRTSAPTSFATYALCVMCPNEGKLTCGDYDAVTYCTPVCMDADAAAHSMLCSMHGEFVQRPSENMRRAIYVLESLDDSIRFTWVQFQDATTEDDERHHIALVGGYFSVPRSKRMSHYVTDSNSLSRPLSHTIRIITTIDDSAFAQLNPNTSRFLNIRLAHSWNGPLLAIALQGNKPKPILPIGDDIQIEDLRHILDYLGTYRSRAVMNDFDRYYGRTIRGVRINCSGDLTSGEPRDEFEEVRIPISHASFSQANPSLLPIASQLGIPIIATKYPRREEDEATIKGQVQAVSVRREDWNSAYRDLDQSWLLESQEILAAHSFDLISTDEMVAEYYSGTVVLVRKDEKPLYAKQVEALWRFNKYFLEPKMTHASRDSASSETERNLITKTIITKVRFEQFYADGRCFQKTAVERTVPSPYEVKKRLGSLKRKNAASFVARITKKPKWEWLSDDDEEDAEETQKEKEDQK